MKDIFITFRALINGPVIHVSKTRTFTFRRRRSIKMPNLRGFFFERIAIIRFAKRFADKLVFTFSKKLQTSPILPSKGSLVCSVALNLQIKCVCIFMDRTMENKLNGTFIQCHNSTSHKFTSITNNLIKIPFNNIIFSMIIEFQWSLLTENSEQRWQLHH
jgi:hypothetical protein